VGFERQSQVLVIRDLGSVEERVLAPDLGNLEMPRWSPDGGWILVRGDGPQGPGVYRVSMSTGAASRFLGQQDRFPQWSAGGREVFFVSPGTPRPVVRMMDLDTNTERTIVEDAFLFSVSRDGRRFAIVRRTTDGDRIYVGNVNGGSLRELFKVPINTITEIGGWTPDGLELMVSQRQRTGPISGPRKPTDILAVPTAGGAARKIATLELTDPRTFRLSPDGTKVSFEAGYPSQSMWVVEQFLRP
jgi:Tol biopolymer transport system component